MRTTTLAPHRLHNKSQTARSYQYCSTSELPGLQKQAPSTLRHPVSLPWLLRLLRLRGLGTGLDTAGHLPGTSFRK